MLSVHEDVDVDLGEDLLEIENPLGIPYDILYNRKAINLTGSCISDEEDYKPESIHEHFMNDMNEVCDMDSQSSKHEGLLENGHSPIGRKSLISQEDISASAENTIDTITTQAREVGSTTAKSSTQPRKPKPKPKPKHQCSICRKTFKRAHNLKIHGRLHSGVKPYGCPFPDCEKEFRWKSSIVSHLNWHRNKKGDLLPGNFSDIHALIKKKKKKEVAVPQPKQEAVVLRDTLPIVKNEEDEIRDNGNEPYCGIGSNNFAMEGMSTMQQMSSMVPYYPGIRGARFYYDSDSAEREAKDDATVLSRNTTSYPVSLATTPIEMGEMFPVLDVKEWEPRNETHRPGITSAIDPNIACCRMNQQGVNYDSFLGDN